jgi:CCR4-NOT transcriptional regulation complex NOT5 subunit
MDILARDGLCFFFAIKKGNVELLQLLLDYYKQNTLNKYKETTTDYNIAKYKLCEVIEENLRMIPSEEIDPEIKETLDKFIGYPIDNEEDESDDRNLDEDFADDLVDEDSGESSATDDEDPFRLSSSDSSEEALSRLTISGEDRMDNGN